MTQNIVTSLLLGFGLSVVIAALAYWRGSLSRSGAAGAVLVGTLIFGLGGWIWGVVLAVFFISSSALSHFKEREKAAVAEKFEKGHRRDMGHVLANGGLGAVIALLSAVVPASAVPGSVWFYLFLGVMATVTADTWATELGTLSAAPPRLITSGRVVEVGTSGGVSPLGTSVSLGGGLLIGLTAGVLSALAGHVGWGAALLVAVIGALSPRATNLLLRHLPQGDGAPRPPLWHDNAAVARLVVGQQRFGQPAVVAGGWAGCGGAGGVVAGVVGAGLRPAPTMGMPP